MIDSPQISDPVAARIVAFLREIGLDVQVREIVEPTFLPGVQIEHGGLVVDPARLKDAGDLLHEAGHLAVVEPTQRAAMHIDAGDSPANEMMAIGWSYAALLHLELPPSVVFHERGYKGGAQSLIDNFAGGRYLGVPMLQWVGLTLDDTRAREAGESPYPHMLRWLRAE